MAEPRFAGDDDLPRTFRREREAREREAAAKAHDYAAQQAYAPQPEYGGGAPDGLYSAGASGTVTRFEVPFFHLVRFFLKAVLAAIPALFLLAALLFGGGKLLQSFFPSLRLFEIKIQPIEAAAPPSATAPAAGPKGTPPLKR